MKPGRAVAEAKAAGLAASAGKSRAALTTEHFLANLHASLPGVGPEGRFHDNKVFIDAAHQAFAGTAAGKGVTLAEFKAKLIELNTAGKVHLSRADMVQAMDLARVARSEAAHLNATFHFIYIGKTGR